MYGYLYTEEEAQIIFDRWEKEGQFSKSVAEEENTVEFLDRDEIDIEITF